MWGKFSARKGGVKGKISKLLPGPFNKATIEIRKLVERWYLFRQEVGRKIELLNEIDRSCA